MPTEQTPQEPTLRATISLEEPAVLREVRAAVTPVQGNDYAEVSVGQDGTDRPHLLLLDISCRSLRYNGSTPDRRTSSYTIEAAGLLALHSALSSAIAQAQRDGILPEATTWDGQ